MANATETIFELKGPPNLPTKAWATLVTTTLIPTFVTMMPTVPELPEGMIPSPDQSKVTVVPPDTDVGDKPV